MISAPVLIIFRVDTEDARAPRGVSHSARNVTAIRVGLHPWHWIRVPGRHAGLRVDGCHSSRR